jgi:hypothetical protein
MMWLVTRRCRCGVTLTPMPAEKQNIGQETGPQGLLTALEMLPSSGSPVSCRGSFCCRRLQMASLMGMRIDVHPGRNLAGEPNFNHGWTYTRPSGCSVKSLCLRCCHSRGEAAIRWRLGHRIIGDAAQTSRRRPRDSEPVLQPYCPLRPDATTSEAAVSSSLLTGLVPSAKAPKHDPTALSAALEPLPAAISLPLTASCYGRGRCLLVSASLAPAL